jgi:DNA-directed RNA polymerase sigma subunit (sigma70/sigma32)
VNKFERPCEQSAYKCGIFICRRLYDEAWAETLKKFPITRNPELPRDKQGWHHFYRTLLESLPLLAKEQELELLTRWQLGADIEARNHLILCLARITGPIAGRAVARRFPMLNGDGWLEAVHEIIGWGNLGLVDAPSKVTLSRGYRLSTVATSGSRNTSMTASLRL